ncbi:hypothetical protein [Kangiella spongicola]|uniref:Uncharacterized protein n=1 Tax=Kangiella spongicola TaxID=796379 RepID=A0A318DC25_9GAMM|nr:hypothetical protein [Kangiella spongicola]PXF64497.1 hypothetical protein DL796_04985 [Kangiella spongicola]
MIKFITGVFIGFMACFIVLEDMDSGTRVAQEAGNSNEAIKEYEQNSDVIGMDNSDNNSLVIKRLEAKNKELSEELAELKANKGAAPIRPIKSLQEPDVEKAFYQDLPETHKDMLNFDNIGTRFGFLESVHAEFITEEKNDHWALEKEQQIESYLYSHPSSELFRLIGVKCKTSICEIYATVYSLDNAVWSQVVNDMKLQAWWESKFNTVTVQKRNTKGELNVFTVLQ